MLKGKKVALRPLKLSDVELFIGWFNDLEVIRYLTAYLPMNELSEKEWVEKAMKDRAPYFVIEKLLENGKSQPIGNCSLHQQNQRDRRATLGIAIGDKSCWSQGLGTEAIGLLVEYGFKSLNLNKIESEAFAFNERSVKAHQKAGFAIEGVRRQCHFSEGEYHDSMIFGLLKEEWETKNK